MRSKNPSGTPRAGSKPRELAKPSPGGGKSRHPENPQELPPSDPEINDFFLDCCPLTDRGLDYFLQRGVSADLVLCMGLGFLDDSRRVFRLMLERFGRDRLNEAGYLKKTGGFVFGNSQIVFPYFQDRKPVFFKTMDLNGRAGKFHEILAKRPCLYNVDVLRFLKPTQTVYLGHGPLEVLEILDKILSFERRIPFGVLGVEPCPIDFFSVLRPYRIVLTRTDDPVGMEFKRKLDKEFQKRISVVPAWEAIQ